MNIETNELMDKIKTMERDVFTLKCYVKFLIENTSMPLRSLMELDDMLSDDENELM